MPGTISERLFSSGAYLLQEDGDARYHLGATVLQRKHSLWRLDEELALAVLHVILVVMLLDDHLTALPITAAAVVRPRPLRDDLVAEHKPLSTCIAPIPLIKTYMHYSSVNQAYYSYERTYRLRKCV